MKKNFSKKQLVYYLTGIFFLGIQCSLTATAYSQTATGAASYLRLGNGARGIAIGKAFTSMVDDASAVYWNPAGLTRTKNLEVLATNRMQTDKDLGVNLYSGAASVQVGRFGYLGAGIMYYGVSDILEYDESANFLGKFDVTERALYAAYAFQFSSLRIGATGKMLSQDFNDQTPVYHSGYGVDLGLMYAITSQWNLGIIVRDDIAIGPSDEVPLAVQTGTGYSFRELFGLNYLNVALDLEQVKNRPMRIHAGAETMIMADSFVGLFFRLGMSNMMMENRGALVDKGTLSSNSRKLSFGFGVRIGRARALYIDYAYVMEEFDSSGFVSLRFSM